MFGCWSSATWCQRSTRVVGERHVRAVGLAVGAVPARRRAPGARRVAAAGGRAATSLAGSRSSIEAQRQPSPTPCSRPQDRGTWRISSAVSGSSGCATARTAGRRCSSSASSSTTRWSEVLGPSKHRRRHVVMAGSRRSPDRAPAWTVALRSHPRRRPRSLRSEVVGRDGLAVAAPDRPRGPRRRRASRPTRRTAPGPTATPSRSTSSPPQSIGRRRRGRARPAGVGVRPPRPSRRPRGPRNGDVGAQLAGEEQPGLDRVVVRADVGAERAVALLQPQAS